MSSNNSSPEGEEKNYFSDFSNFSDDQESESDEGTTEDIRRDVGRTKKYSHSKEGFKIPPLPVNSHGSKSKRSSLPNGIIKVASKESSSILEKASTARRFKMNDLQNEIKLLNQKIKELESENKLLKRTQRRQSVALKRYEGSEGELPILIRRHEEEVRALRDQLRKMTDKYRSTDRMLRERTSEMERIRMQLQRLQSMVREQNLEERSLLTKKLENFQLELSNKEKSVQEISHRLELTEKNYKHQLSIEFARHRETKKKLTQVQLMLDKTMTALKEKERELDIRNIYSSRTSRSPRPPTLMSGNLSSPKSQLNLKVDNEIKKNPNVKNINVDMTNGEKLAIEGNSDVTFLDSLRESKIDGELVSERKSYQQQLEESPVFPSDLFHSQYMDNENAENSLEADTRGFLLELKSLQDDEYQQLQNAAFQTNEFRTIPIMKQGSLTNVSGRDAAIMNSISTNNGDKRQHFVGSTNSLNIDLLSFPSERKVQSSGNSKENEVSYANSIYDKESGFNGSQMVSSKSRKLNLMRQLFGSVERNASKTEDDGVTSHLIIRTSSSGTDNVLPSTGIKYKSPTDDFIDIFNNNIPISPNVLSRHGRERKNLTPKQIKRTMNGNVEEETTSVLF